jgi:hypothetical protein
VSLVAVVARLPAWITAMLMFVYRFQQLELKHVEDKGCFGALEFR